MQIPDNAILPAVLWDAENRQLANVEAQFLFADKRGWFRPVGIATQAILGNLAKAGAIVQMSDGKRVKIQKLELCPHIPPPHFHFEIR